MTFFRSRDIREVIIIYIEFSDVDGPEELGLAGEDGLLLLAAFAFFKAEDLGF